MTDDHSTPEGVRIELDKATAAAAQALMNDGYTLPADAASYARDAIEASGLRTVLVERDQLREALAFYADRVNYAPQNPPGTGSPIWRDAGRRAREALDV